MNWGQNENLVEQILRTGMYASLYDKETTYGYLTYLTYRVEDALLTWKKGKRYGRVLGRPHMGGIYRLFAAGKNIAPGSPKGAAQYRDGVPCLRI